MNPALKTLLILIDVVCALVITTFGAVEFFHKNYALGAVYALVVVAICWNIARLVNR